MSDDSLQWFRPEDLEHLLRALSTLDDPRNLVLVGGQAIVYWLDYFGIAPEKDRSVLSADADFVGTGRDAGILAEVLHAEVLYAPVEDATPNAAIIQYTTPDGRRLSIDVLKILMGLTKEEVQSRAVSFEREGNRIAVMHPVHCLKSRFANLMHLPGKRGGNGRSQAQAAVEIVAAYIAELIVTGEHRQALRDLDRVARIAASPEGVFCFHEFRLDPLSVLPVDRLPYEMFHSRAWPAEVAKVTYKRDVDRRRRQRWGRRFV